MHYSAEEGVLDQVRGAKIVGVEPGEMVDDYVRARTDTVDLALEDGRKLRLKLYGDCCSISTYEDVKQFDELVGATIQKIEEREGWPNYWDTPIEPTLLARATALDEKAKADEDGEYLHWHFLVFETNKGHVTIDWRNDSNGYYDGDICPSIIAPTAN